MCYQVLPAPIAFVLHNCQLMSGVAFQHRLCLEHNDQATSDVDFLLHHYPSYIGKPMSDVAFPHHHGPAHNGQLTLELGCTCPLCPADIGQPTLDVVY